MWLGSWCAGSTPYDDAGRGEHRHRGGGGAGEGRGREGLVSGTGRVVGVPGGWAGDVVAEGSGVEVSADVHNIRRNPSLDR